MDNEQKPFYLAEIINQDEDKIYFKLAEGETSKGPWIPQ